MKRVIFILPLVFLLQACVCGFTDMITYFATGQYPVHCEELYFYPVTVAEDGSLNISWHSHYYMKEFFLNIGSDGDYFVGQSTYNNSMQVDIDWDERGIDSIEFDVFVQLATIQGEKTCITWGSYSRVLPPNSTNSVLNCTQLLLTSPQGLPQGDVTFYWNTVDNAVNYRINVYSGGALLAGWSSPAPNTNLLGNVSEGAIGGSNPLTIELIAEAANGLQCRQSYVMDREALPPIIVPEEPQSPREPDCEANPEQDGC